MMMMMNLPTSDAEYTLFLGDIASYCDENHIEELFQQHGLDVLHVKIMRGKVTLASLNYGFVRMKCYDDAARAIELLDYKLFFGRKLRVTWSGQSNKKNKATESKHSIYVKYQCLTGLSFVTEETLRDVFSAFGSIKDVSLKSATFNKLDAGREFDSGYAFVHFEDDDEGFFAASNAIKTVSPKRVINNVEFVCEASQNMLRYMQERKRSQLYGPDGAPQPMKLLPGQKVFDNIPPTPYNNNNNNNMSNNNNNMNMNPGYNPVHSVPMYDSYGMNMRQQQQLPPMYHPNSLYGNMPNQVPATSKFNNNNNNMAMNGNMYSLDGYAPNYYHRGNNNNNTKAMLQQQQQQQDGFYKQSTFAANFGNVDVTSLDLYTPSIVSPNNVDNNNNNMFSPRNDGYYGVNNNNNNNNLNKSRNNNNNMNVMSGRTSVAGSSKTLDSSINNNSNNNNSNSVFDDENGLMNGLSLLSINAAPFMPSPSPPLLTPTNNNNNNNGGFSSALFPATTAVSMMMGNNNNNRSNNNLASASSSVVAPISLLDHNNLSQSTSVKVDISSYLDSTPSVVVAGATASPDVPVPVVVVENKTTVNDNNNNNNKNDMILIGNENSDSEQSDSATNTSTSSDNNSNNNNNHGHSTLIW